MDELFPQEDELKTKSARLEELNILLNLDKRENEIVDRGGKKTAKQQTEKRQIEKGRKWEDSLL